MSMLAEPRRKQKWTLNPRGKQWSEDTNKFGQRMLEKMGWTSGKGLGANEQGMTEHVRVSYKDNTAGIGFKKENLDKAWTEHQDGFNDFLQELQKSQSNSVSQTQETKSELSGKSLEAKSKQSRARVHYQKFTRGKDVNKYSSKDLANIFGQKDLVVEKNGKDKEIDDLESPDPIGARDNSGGVVTINGGNINDYFNKKGQDFPFMIKSKRRRENNSESEPDYAGFGFASANAEKGEESKDENKNKENVCNYAFENPCLKLNSPENISSGDESKSSRKRKVFNDNEMQVNNGFKKFKVDAVDKNECTIGFVNNALNIECQADSACNGKEFEVSRAEFGLANSALDISDEIEDKKRVTFNDHVEYSSDSAKKKKGRATLDRFEVEIKKKSKKKKKRVDAYNNDNNFVSSGFINEALDVEETPEEVNDNEINERKSRKSKKRKNSRRSKLETIVEIPEEDKEVIESEIKTKEVEIEEIALDDSVSQENVNKKAKKKKKQQEKERTEVEIVRATENSVDEVEAGELGAKIDMEEENNKSLSKEKKKKKKKNKHEVIDLTHEDIAEVNDVDMKEEVEHIEESKKVSKKSKEKKRLKEEERPVDSIVEVADAKDEEKTFDAVNANGTSENTPKPKKPKRKRQKESVDELIDNSTHNVEPIKEASSKETMNTTLETPSKSAFNGSFVSSSPWSNKARMSKRLLKAFFHRNAVDNFPGSNIYEIQGYGFQRQ